MRINLRLAKALLVTNIGAVTGSGGTTGTGFGIEFPRGITVEALQLATSTSNADEIRRGEAEILLGGITTKMGPVNGSIKIGSASAAEASSPRDAFIQSQQQNIPVGTVSLSYPLQLVNGLALTFNLSQLRRLSTGGSPTWQRETYQTRKGSPGGSAGLGLTSNFTEKKSPSPIPSPGSFLERLTTVGVSISMEIQ